MHVGLKVKVNENSKNGIEIYIAQKISDTGQLERSIIQKRSRIVAK